MEVLGLVGMLSICTVEDLWKRQIHLVVISAFGILGVLLHFYDGKQTALNMCGGMLVGIVLYLISILSHGKVGKGDAFLVTSMGVYLGFWNNLTILWMASVMAAIFGVVACVFFQKKKEESLPFVPFLLVAYLLFLCLGAAAAKVV